MLGKIKKILASSAAVFLLTLGVLPAVTVSAAEIEGSACKGANLDLAGNADDNTCQNTTKGAASSLNSLIARIINAFSIIVGIVCVIMIIYGGFRYVTSGGATDSVTTAKNTILYAIIGLVIVAFAQFIVKFVLSKATGVTETT